MNTSLKNKRYMYVIQRLICFLSIKFDPCLVLRVSINMPYYKNVPRWIREIPRHLKTQEMCEEVIWIEPRSLAFLPDCFKTEGLCIKAVRRNPYALDCVPDNVKTQKTCIKAMRENSAVFFLVPDRFKTQEMCNDAVDVDPLSLRDVVQRDSYYLQFISHWFVTQEQLEIWHDDDDYCTDDEIVERYKRYKKRKAQKSKIKEELLPIALYPDRVKDWCMSEDEKRR